MITGNGRLALKSTPATIDVTWIETGVTRRMFRKDFFEIFGDDEGEEVLAGYHPAIVAVEN